MFIDRAKIVIKSGRGGDGAVSFRREPFVPNGGPDGGNGGKGGDVVFAADRGLRTLMDLRYRKLYKADNGENGAGANKYGKNAEDLVIKLPIGCVLIDEASGAFMADLAVDGARFVAALGGKGGLGNSKFKNSVRQAPNFAEAGSEGQERALIIELKLIADIGLVGLPNAGKSTLLAAATGAKPKIANYRFTTLSPNLGVAERFGKSFVLADIPGLIEGAAEGAGLGHDFLKHIERTKGLIHVVDASGQEGREPLDDYKTIEREMAEYSPLLPQKPVICALNKMDAADEKSEGILALEEYLKEKGVRSFRISAAARQGIDELLNAAAEILEEAERAGDGAAGEFLDQSKWVRVTRIEDEPDYREIYIERGDDGAFVLSGKQLEKIFNSTNFNDQASVGYLNKYLVNNGIIEKLKAQGLSEGGTIRIKDFELEWFEDE